MIYRDVKRPLTVQVARSYEAKTDRHIIAYADDGMAGVERFLSERPRGWTQSESETAAKTKQWDLDLGYEGAKSLARKGWPEGARELEAGLRAVMPAAGREGRWGHSVAGSSVDIGRFVRGHPAHMRTRRKRVSGSSPVYHLVVNGSASCSVNAKQMKNYGIAICGLVDMLENAGKRVILDVVFCLTLQNDKTKAAVGWNVKKAGEHMDMSAVAFSVAHPAAFRRLAFAMMERLPSETNTWGYGHPADIQPEDVPDYTEGMMLIDGVSFEPSRCVTPKDALRLAVEQLNKAAVLAGHATVDQPLIEPDEFA